MNQVQQYPAEILILRPQPYWAIVAAELRRVVALGRYMETGPAVRTEHLPASSSDELRQLATVCADLQPEKLYTRYANKKLYRHQKDFWENGDSTLRQHIKRMADQQLLQAVRIASGLGLAIVYAPDASSPLHIDERLSLDTATRVTPKMHFQRYEQGTRYELTLTLLRDGQATTVTPAEHSVTVLGHEPGLFILDDRLLLLDEGFSCKLLLPFMKKTTVEIPHHMEADYFRRFIKKNVSKAEVVATGFEIADTGEALRPLLALEQTFTGKMMLGLHFRYGDVDYTADSQSHGRVQMQETADGFRFIRTRRDRKAEQMVMDTLHRDYGLSASGCLSFGTTAEAIGWLQLHGQQLRQLGIDVVQPSDHIYYIGPLSVEQSETWNGDWLQTDVTVIVDGGRLRLPFRDLRATILRGEQDYLLPTGEHLLIPQEWLQRYGDLLLSAQPSGKGFRRHRSQLEQADATAAPTAAPSLHAPAIALPAALQATLRPYQQKGFEWLWANFMNQTGCCLSDEMGLGKTVQTIALLLKYKETAPVEAVRATLPGLLFTEEEMQGRGAPPPATRGGLMGTPPPFHTCLVVSPASVVHNWVNELRRFAPSLLVCNYTGDVATRRDKRQALLRWDVVVTTYHTLRADIDMLAPMLFGIAVFDESQAFKTADSMIHKAVSRLKPLHSMALSGTPVENNLMELWSLMDVLNPNLLGSQKSFQQVFVAPIARQMEQQRTILLQRLIAPYFLKRTKDQVLTQLPERQDEVVVCPMTESQASHYAAELSKARNAVSEGATTINVLAAIQRLRHIANGEGKMQEVFERLESLRGTRHKVLLFSEYVTMLQQVANQMEQRHWTYAMLTGQIQQREQVIGRFQTDDDCQFFLISLKAGGVGLNLTAADYVFVLDPWWNIAAEEQAIARSHRIGQHRPVFVYRFVAENTLEQQILNLQERKQTLIDSVMPFISGRQQPSTFSKKDGQKDTVESLFG